MSQRILFTEQVQEPTNSVALPTIIAQLSNTAAVYANGTLSVANANLNFNNTSTVNVSVSSNGTQANISFTANSSAITGSTNATSEGFATLSGGVIVAWGTLPAVTDSAYHFHAFPVAFPTNCWNVQLQPFTSTAQTALLSATTSVVTTTNVSRTGFSWATSANWNNGTAGIPLYYCAIGN